MNRLAWRLAGALLIVIAFVGGAVFAGWRSGLTTDVTVVTEPRDHVVTAAVEMRELHDTFATRATVEMAGVVHVPSPSSGDARSVVTDFDLEGGDLLEEGKLVAEIAGRPVFVFQGKFPLYRPLVKGSEGPDVAQLQEALARLGLYEGAVDGRFGGTTEAAVRAFYSQSGYELPGSDGGSGSVPSQREPLSGVGTVSVSVSIEEFIFLPEVPCTVVTTYADVGAVLEPGARLLDVSTGEVRVTASVPVFRSEQLQVGTEAILLDERSGTEFNVKIASIGTPRLSDEGSQVVDIELHPPTDARDIVGRNVRLTFTLAATDGPVLTVPITAIWASGDDTFVTVIDGPASHDVLVTPGLAVDGWVHVESNTAEGLEPGDQVVVQR